MLISGGTVMIAMGGMLFAGTKVFSSLGIGAMLVVLTTMVGSLTVLPALLGKLGDRVERGVLAVLAALVLRPLRRFGQPRPLVWLRDRQTLLRRVKGERETSRLWSAILRPALRFPAIAAAVAAAGLIVLATPVFGMHLKQLSFNDLPQNMQIVKSYEKVQSAFPGAQIPAVVVVKADDVRAPRGAAGDRRHASATRSPRTRCSAPSSTKVNSAHTVERVEIPLAGDGEGKTSVAALKTLRERVIPATIGTVAGVDYAVTGQTAGDHDWTQTTKHARADRVRVRARPGVPAAPADVQVGRDPAHGDRAQPAVRRSGLRRARVDLPGRPPPGPARASTRTAASSPGYRCSCSWSCSASRWTTTCSS